MSQQSHTPNVIVFGQTGSGKSSLINMLAGRDVAKVSSGVVGCTTVAESYNIPPESPTHTFLDTPGLNEGEYGSVPAQQAFSRLCSLTKNYGINLLIYCIRGPRLADILRVNYDLFYGIMCEAKVPIVLVVTGLEIEDNMDDWWKSSEAAIKRMGMTFDGHACVTTTKGRDEIYQEKFRLSERTVWDLVKEHCSPVPCITRAEWLVEIPSRMERYMREYNSRTGKERKVLPKHGKKNPKQSSSASKGLSSNTHNVILFGESGAGKSSIVNMIVGKDVAKVSNSPTGCTFENDSYETRIGDTAYRIYDTVGLNEGDEGRVPHWKAIQELYTLIRQLDGVSLLIFCMKGRMKSSARANWLFFFDAICGKKVPIIAVVTGLEQEENLEEAERAHKEAFQKYSMVPKEVACVVSIKGKNNEYEEQYKLSQERLQRLIPIWRRAEPWSTEKEQWFSQLFHRTYDLQICIFAKTRLQFVEEILGALEDFKRKSNLGENDLDKVIKGLLQAEKRYLKAKSSNHG